MLDSIHGQSLRLRLINPAHLKQIDEQALGSGASGSVRRAVHTPSGRVIALKTINIADKSKRDQVYQLYRHIATNIPITVDQ
jgi:hypothetical protein